MKGVGSRAIVASLGLSVVASAVLSAAFFAVEHFHWQFLVPVAIAALPLVPRGRLWLAWVATLLLFGWDGLSIMSVGIYYVPATIAMLIAAIQITNETPRGRLRQRESH